MCMHYAKLSFKITNFFFTYMYITYVEPMHRSVDKHTYICIHDIHSFSYIDYIDINNKYYNAYVQFKTNKPIHT